MDFFKIAWVELFHHRQQVAGCDVLPDLKGGQPRQPQAGEGQSMQGFDVASLSMSPMAMLRKR